jgi:vacuolar-type H+-ATPase subunit F/Vma7
MEMRGRITAITTPDLAAGFQLAGVEAFSVHCAAEAEEVLRRLFKEGGASLVIVHQDLLEDFDPCLRHQIETSYPPIVVGIPGRTGGVTREERLRDISELMGRAIGFHVTFGPEPSGVCK